MDKENARDTQFQGFAKATLDELCEISIIDIETPFNDDWREEWERIIARRAYDLAYSVAKETSKHWTQEIRAVLKSLEDAVSARGLQ